MGKRKRPSETELEQKLSEYQQELFRAIKAAKGLERQRLGKRLQRDKKNPEKIQRLQREVVVLKSLDLRQTAQAHLAASLAKISAVADHPAIPDSIKQGPPKLDLSGEDKISMHNVTSALYNFTEVREVIERAVNGVCLELELPIPENKKRKRQKSSDAQKDAEESLPEGQADRAGSAPPSKRDNPDASDSKKRKVVDAHDEDDDDHSSFLGFSDVDADKHGDVEGESDEVEENHENDDEREEALLSKYDELLGDSEEEREEENAEALRAKYAALLNAPPDDELNDAEDESDEQDDLGDIESDIESDLGDSDGDGQASSTGSASSISPPSPSPPPQQPAAKKKKEAKRSTSAPTTTTFLPSLMGGYFSGSESASDVDVAPRKKRLGQRQRQAIAQRKFGEEAKHVQKMAEREKRKAGRDHGWDMKRGAVDGADTGRKPWKKGISNPLSAVGQREKHRHAGEQHGRGPGNADRTAGGRPFESKSKEKEGPLHPSWQAKKKKEEEQRSAKFQGSKIKF
ncbi:Bud-site selection protein [Sodiomyces alkalinus F11]|uniref:Bud-site selection protein n=1 Tax=Sodiomyces alkalinus (strain CBS 110278 / VKM F-3762 / F11) TaxID=1314773 RepID=A0A3N2Q6U2_SODAK|nr:Bud-site selection protein [Sodiomyces alkalinus F11]ROT42503.1 Bud-site selection protein [Sodiomyces alkalinus F11]